MNNTKPFNEDQYDQDDPAKLLVIEHLQGCGGTAWINPDKYGIDLLASFRDRNFAFEVEVKHNWKGLCFPYESIHFSTRKLKFLENEAWVWFVMLNHECTHAILVDGNRLRHAKRITKDTTHTKQETFLEIPIEQVEFRTL